MADSSNSRMAIWSGFHRKTLQERQVQLQLMYPDVFLLDSNDDDNAAISNNKSLLALHNIQSASSSMANLASTVSTPVGSISEDARFPIAALSQYAADFMIENCVGVLGFPVGLAPNFIINGESRVIPMATEEPSVVASCNSAAKMISLLGDGFETSISTPMNTIQAQIKLGPVQTMRIPTVSTLFELKKLHLIEEANKYCPSMVNRGGGVIDANIRYINGFNDDSKWVIVHLIINVCESMGANCANTVAEGISKQVQDILEIESLHPPVSIVSNLNDHRLSRAVFKIPLQKLSYKSISGRLFADRIVEMYHWANEDVHRAVTHNKGIMNGIDAVAIATGQDFRAIEAACHAFASLKSNRYKSLTKYYIKTNEREQECLYGELELPISVGVIGGAIKSNPVYRYTFGLLGNPTVSELAQIFTCVGLAQNFAALRALISTGIQHGHMALHARNIAISAGTPMRYITEVADYMTKTRKITLETAKEYLHAREIHEKIYKQVSAGNETVPNILILDIMDMDRINIAFPCIDNNPIILDLKSSSSDMDNLSLLIFGDKSVDWIVSILKIIESINFLAHTSRKITETAHQIQKKMKLILILTQIVLRQLMNRIPDHICKFVSEILDKRKRFTFSKHLDSYMRSIHRFIDDIKKSGGSDDIQNKAISTSISLLVSLMQTFDFLVLESCGNKLLKKILLHEHGLNISLVVNSHIINNVSADTIQESFVKYSRKFQMELFFLIDVMNEDDEVISKASLNSIIEVGLRLNVIVAYAHDLTRSLRTDSFRYRSQLGNEDFRKVILQDGQFVNDFFTYIDNQDQLLMTKDFLVDTLEKLKQWYNISLI